MLFSRRLRCKVIEPLEPTFVFLLLCSPFNGMSSQPARVLYSCGSPMGLPIHQRFDAFHPLADLLNVSIDLHYCPHRKHDSLLFVHLRKYAHVCATLLRSTLETILSLVLKLFVIHLCQRPSRYKK